MYLLSTVLNLGEFLKFHKMKNNKISYNWTRVIFALNSFKTCYLWRHLYGPHRDYVLALSNH